ncbi:hypothetical protein BH10PSE1_BH10PSE1_02650 [soil metagenome]
MLKARVGWVLAAIAAASFLSPFLYPRSWVLLDSGRLLLWPKYAVVAVLLAVWIAVWTASLKRVRAPLLLVLVTLMVTAWPLTGLAFDWGCLSGGCDW